MKAVTPRKLWSTFRKFTYAPAGRSRCAPDEQWEHWASQGDIIEPVWSDQLSTEAEAWCEELRQKPLSELSMQDIAPIEAEEARKRVKGGKAAGVDGLPSDVIVNLSCLSTVVPLLFSWVARTITYPKAWGIGLIRALLKPGKPPESASSLRVIRL
jgi:hypothetical protein